MPDIKSIEAQIRTRLSEVQAQIEPLRIEAEQLSAMTAAFSSENAAPPQGRPSRATRASARTARAAARSTGGASGASTDATPRRGRPMGSGNRAQQAVAKINQQPGITASELAKSMGISPNYLYRVLPRLEREGKVTKRGRGYHPAAAAAAAAAAETASS